VSVPADLALDPWWRGFGAPELDAAVAAALAANPDLAAAAARVRAARAHARAVAGARLPQVAAELDLTRSRRNLIGLPIPGAGEVLPVTTDQHGLGLQLAWELDLWSRLDAAAEAATRDSQAAEADRHALALALAGHTARLWILQIQQRHALDILMQRVAIAEQNFALARSRFAAGTSPASAVAVAEAAHAALLAAAEHEGATLSATRAQLAAISGEYPEADGAQSAPAALPALPASVPAGLPAELLARRPDLAAAGLRVRAARARAVEADAALLPRILLTSGGGTSTAELGDLLDGNFRVWSIAGNLVAPLFQGGRLRAQAEAADAATTAAEAEFVSRALTAFAEVETALAAEAGLRRAYTHRQTGISALTRDAVLARRRFADGTGEAAALLAATDRLLEAESAALTERLALLLNRVDLHLALGGGFATPLTP
jgi:NodT family efflux transporter outer membrane factor (OMF) lipoprotein